MSDVREDILENLCSDTIETHVHKMEDKVGLENGVLCDISDLGVTIQKTLESFKYFLTNASDTISGIQDNTLRVYIKQGDSIMGIGYTNGSNLRVLNYYLRNIGGKLYTCNGDTIKLYDSSSIENIVLHFDAKLEEQ